MNKLGYRRAATLAAAFSVLAALPLPAQDRATSVFPQFAAGGGWGSDLFFANQGSGATVVDVALFGDDGTPLVIDSSLGSGSSFSISLAGGGSGVLRATATGNLQTGYVVVSFPAGGAVRASEVFTYQEKGSTVAALGVSQQFPVQSYSFPAEVDAARGVNTGLAIATGAFDGSAATNQKVVVNLVRADGTLQDTAVVSFPAGGHTSLYLNSASLFPGLDGFSGTVSVSSIRPFGLLALRQDQAAFGSVAVDAGPVVAPFLLTSAAISEVERNDTAATAQRLTPAVVVAGSVGFAGDTDYYQFTGTAGDVLTAIVSTASLNSALDSLLYLLSADGRTVLAENDENGLFYQSDSFLQLVLPSDGTYYLAVTDYQSRGGFNGTYRLHVRTATPVSR